MFIFPNNISSGGQETLGGRVLGEKKKKKHHNGLFDNFDLFANNTEVNFLDLMKCEKKLIDASVQFSHSVVSDSLRPHESQHARPPCPSPSPGVHSKSRPSSW